MANSFGAVLRRATNEERLWWKWWSIRAERRSLRASIMATRKANG